jgi:hypothetical protein
VEDDGSGGEVRGVWKTARPKGSSDCTENWFLIENNPKVFVIYSGILENSRIQRLSKFLYS